MHGYVARANVDGYPGVLYSTDLSGKARQTVVALLLASWTSSVIIRNLEFAEDTGAAVAKE
ncbi:hypothetical protein A1D31_35705 [Bradyrhizobium liaoningense]|nr:hypothetical protein A1D31_35705 [Bradyrhizobium liaoningense]